MAQERGGGQSRQALTHEARSECAHRWPARGRRGCSAREVTSSLSRGHREEGDGVDGGAGDHHSPGHPRPRSRRGCRCRPTRLAPPGRSLLGPCRVCTRRPAGPQPLSPGSLGTLEPRAHHPPPCLTPSAGPWLGATHHALGSPAPRPSHPHLHLHLPGREEDRDPAPHGAAAVLQGWGQPHFFQAQHGICGPGQLRPGAPPSPLAAACSPWPGQGRGVEGGNIKACQ